jgi:hypothetical protein
MLVMLQQVTSWPAGPAFYFGSKIRYRKHTCVKYFTCDICTVGRNSSANCWTDLLAKQTSALSRPLQETGHVRSLCRLMAGCASPS